MYNLISLTNLLIRAATYTIEIKHETYIPKKVIPKENQRSKRKTYCLD